MNEVQLGAIDLNLLVVLDLLLRERSVTRTAQQLHRTPSAISHALKRLRELFGDELLVRDGRRMRPTVRAEALEAMLHRALQQLAGVLVDPAPFDPATSSRTFRLSAPDFVAPIVAHLLRDVGSVGPGVRIELAPVSTTSVEELSEGRLDALIAPSAIQNEGLRGQPLGTWAWAVFGRSGHPAFADWSLHAWSASAHLQIRTSIRGQGPIDQRASELGIQRVVGAVVPHFSMAAPILAQTDLLLTVPTMVLASTAVAHQLDRREVPFELPQVGLSLFRSAAVGDEPGVRWFLERVAAASRRLTEV